MPCLYMKIKLTCVQSRKEGVIIPYSRQMFLHEDCFFLSEFVFRDLSVV